MLVKNKILLAKNSEKELYIIPKMANRHGLIAGGTGSGKTVTLKVMAESFSDLGVPVFLADVKGDLAGTSIIGEDTEDMKKRVKDFELDKYNFNYKKYPVQFFDIYRESGLPVRVTISSFGPTLLSHIMGLNQTQSDILNVIFKIADDNSLLLLDLKDLKKLIEFVGDNSKDFSASYGNITKASIQSIYRSILSLEKEGIENLFGEPELDISDIIKTDSDGRGFISVLHSSSLILSPRVYSAFMLYLISNLYESLPEVGDLEKPKIIFCFDEAHLLFSDSPKELVKKLEQMTKLIRSKGVGIYFITQDPTDIPDTILQQLGNKVQHVHRAYTAKEKKNHKAICDSFRENKSLNVSEVLETLGTGEALVSFLDDKGAPNVVEFAKVLPPQSKMGGIDDSVRDGEIKASIIYTKYAKDIDRESAYEILNKKIEESIKQEEVEKKSLNDEKILMAEIKERTKEEEKLAKAKAKKINTAIKSVARSTGSTVGREVARSLANSIFGSKSSAAKTIAGNVGSALGRNILGTLLKG